MTILQQPDALSLSGNIKDFRISTPGKISFVLLQGATEILSQSYDPGQDGLVTISLKDIRSRLRSICNRPLPIRLLPVFLMSMLSIPMFPEIRFIPISLFVLFVQV